MNLTKRILICYYTTHIGCLLMGGIFLLLSCGTENNNNAFKERNNTTPQYQYLSLEQSPLNEIIRFNTKTNYITHVTVKRQGNNNDFKITSKVVLWNEEELNRYNKEESYSYTLLLPELCSVTPPYGILNYDISQTLVDIRFNPTRVFTGFKKKGTKNIIPLGLERDEVRIVNTQPDLIPEVTLNYPKVAFVSSDVTSKETATVELPIALKYTVNLDTIGSPWHFSYKLTIQENIGEVVIPYNQSHNTKYELFIQSNYTLKRTINYKTKNTLAKGILCIVRKKELEIENYLLSFAPTEV